MTDYLTLAVACVGVGGTLVSPLVSQWSLVRLRRVDEESRWRDRVDEREYLRGREYLATRESIYIDLNSKSRTFREAMWDFWENATGERIDSKSAPRMERARDDYIECQAKAMMQAPDSVLAKVLDVTEKLVRAYRLLSKPEIDTDRLDEAKLILSDPSRLAIRELLHEMRKDLGIADPDDTSPNGLASTSS